MRIVMFYHSLRSDWNHGNAHFLRGVAAELMVRGHEVQIHEPADGWSAGNLAREYGKTALDAYRAAYPRLTSSQYSLASLDLDRALDGADLVLVHEWNDHDLVRLIGQHRARNRQYRLLFHDTHHRAVTQPDRMAAYDLRNYDGVLAFGAAIRDIYERRGWAERVWTWHEAADVRLFHPRDDMPREGDVVWIGNWGDEERSAEIFEFLVEPVRALGASTNVYGVRYPDHAIRSLRDAGITYRGWIPNFRVPDVFGAHRGGATIHIPRGPYVRALPGIPTIRVFEALACGIPLISAPWYDVEQLFSPGDYLTAASGEDVRRLLRGLLRDDALAQSLRENGLARIRERHTCAHRVDELLAIHESIAPGPPRATRAAPRSRQSTTELVI